MITTLPPQSARPAKPARTHSGPEPQAAPPLATDFHLLGLRPREARVEVIRQAVHQAASQAQLDSATELLLKTEAPDTDSSEGEQRLTEIAVAGYRLLDPRRRKTLFERVQLLMWTEEELDTNVTSLWARQPEAPPKVTINLKSRAARSTNAAPVGEAVVESENQVALELFRSMRERDRRATALWIGLAGLTVSLAVTLAVFAYLV